MIARASDVLRPVTVSSSAHGGRVSRWVNRVRAGEVKYAREVA